MMSPPVASTSVPQSVIDVLYQSVERTLLAQCRHRYDVDVSIQRRGARLEEAGARLQVDCHGLLRVSGRLAVLPNGKETYEVVCTIEETASRRFTYSRPEEWGTTLSHAPVLARQVATFIREELEKRLGRRLLQGPAGRSLSGRPVPADRKEP